MDFDNIGLATAGSAGPVPTPLQKYFFGVVQLLQQNSTRMCCQYFTVLPLVLHKPQDNRASSLTSHSHQCFFISIRLSGRYILVFGAVFVLVCWRRVLVLPQYSINLRKVSLLHLYYKHDDIYGFTLYLFVKCDWILENRSKSHIWYFEKYQFQYSRHYISVVLDCSHARLAPVVD